MIVLRYMQKYFATIPPMFLDGCLYVGMAALAAIAVVLGSDEAVKFIHPLALWIARSIVGVSSATALALKMFRSTSFADHQQVKKDIANGTNLFTKPNP